MLAKAARVFTPSAATTSLSRAKWLRWAQPLWTRMALSTLLLAWGDHVHLLGTRIKDKCWDGGRATAGAACSFTMAQTTAFEEGTDEGQGQKVGVGCGASSPCIAKAPTSLIPFTSQPQGLSRAVAIVSSIVDLTHDFCHGQSNTWGNASTK